MARCGAKRLPDCPITSSSWYHHHATIVAPLQCKNSNSPMHLARSGAHTPSSDWLHSPRYWHTTKPAARLVITIGFGSSLTVYCATYIRPIHPSHRTSRLLVHTISYHPKTYKSAVRLQSRAEFGSGAAARSSVPRRSLDWISANRDDEVSGLEKRSPSLDKRCLMLARHSKE